MKFDDLPIFKLLADYENTKNTIERIKKSGKMIFSFGLDLNKSTEEVERERKWFIDHFGKAKDHGITVFESESCIKNYLRMNLELDIEKVFDALEVFTGPAEVEAVFEPYANFDITFAKKGWFKCNNQTSPTILGISKKLKLILHLGSNIDCKWLVCDQSTRRNSSFDTKDLGYFAAYYLMGYWTGYSRKVWVPSSLKMNVDKSISGWYQDFWKDGKTSPLTDTQHYKPLTYHYHGGLQIDMPIVASRKELCLIQPVFELGRLKCAVQRKEKELAEAENELKKAEDGLEAFLLKADLSGSV